MKAAFAANEVGLAHSILLNHEEGDQFEVVQPGNRIDERCGLAAAEQAVQILFFLHIDHRADGVLPSRSE